MNKEPLQRAYDAWLRHAPRDSFPGYCYPRTILPPNGYLSPKLYAVSLFGLLYAAQPDEVRARFRRTNGASLDDEQLCKPDPGAIALGARMVEFGVPTFFVGEDFLRAVAATEPPKEGTLEGLHWPLEAMLFALPLGFMRQYTGRDIGFLAMARMPAGDRLIGRYNIKSDTDKLSFHFPMVCSNGVPIDYRGAYSLKREISYIESSPFLQDPDNKEEAREIGADEISADEEQELNQKMNALSVKLLLAMNARPDLVEYGREASPGKPACQSRAAVPATWHANTLGRAYRIARPEVSAGHHLSPRMHWRRGHMRNQRFGKGRAQVKTVWIEPMLVMAEDGKEGGDEK